MIWMISILTLFFCGCQPASKENHYTELVSEEAVTTPKADAQAADPHAGLDMASMNMPGLEASVSTQSAYTWVLPDGWVQEPGKGFRLASFHLSSDAKTIDASLISLAGAAGGLEANLKRWMGQIGLESSDADLTALINSATTIKIKAGEEGKVFDFTTLPTVKAQDKSMVVVMLALKDATLFVKMTGTVETVSANKGDFFKLVQSIDAKDGATAAVAAPDENFDILKHAQTALEMGKDPHAGMDMNSMGQMMEKIGPSSSILAWTLPATWKEVQASHMRMASFQLASDPKAFDCSIISLGGPAGGLEANLERWAGQLGISFSPELLGRLTGSASSVKTKDGMDIKVYDFSLLQPDAQPTDKSMLTSMILVDKATVFVKLTGSVDTVKKNKDAFIQLLSSIHRK